MSKLWQICIMCVKALTEDHKRWTKKYQPRDKHPRGIPRKRLDSITKRTIDTSVTSDLGPWLPTPNIAYRPTIFDNPRNISSDKENAPPSPEPNEPMNTAMLILCEEDFMDRTNKVLGKDAKWEAHVVQQILLPRSSSPYPYKRPGILEQLEPETEDKININDYSEKPVNDKRPPKPKHAPNIFNNPEFLPNPQNSPDYIAMSAAEQGKQPMREV